ncbi:MAG TPA: N-acetylmuramoyl-L-alanine amidase [Bacteroidales bacterium]|nr:N-acetylmuramoyl-L-alanine amidase [Bacteroidales bacterium]HRR93536.1 N-acetylmuramoyl-L-alanine amidase [Bacteroidales bacterium]HRT88774.1 N-acetylmuramoyl-L-alanine amidase [Bacteroidales bacterium]
MISRNKNGIRSKGILRGAGLFLIIIVFIVSGGSKPVIPEKETWVIVLDPGHGGRDPGAVGTFSYEKNINLAVALKTGQLIEENIKNAKVIYTRKTDVFMDLADRANLANKSKADLFISIHANSHPLKSTYGAETYVMGVHKDQENLEVAMKENEVILLEKDYTTKYEGFDPKSPESYIIFTLMQSAYFEQSTNLASKIQTQFKTQVNRYDRGVKQAGFWVLYMTTMPSVLTELGFISNANEEKFLNSKAGQDGLADALYKSVKDYINEVDKKTGISAVRVEGTDDVTAAVKASATGAGQITFMVQIVSSSKKIPTDPKNFRNLKDITEIYFGNRYRYASGKFYDYQGALEHRKKLEAIFPDAFVIAVKENKIVPLQEAIKETRNK